MNAYNWKIFALLSTSVGIRRWIFIHCYRPRELPTRYASAKIHTRVKKQIHLLVPVFSISLNGWTVNTCERDVFSNIHLLCIFVLYVALNLRCTRAGVRMWFWTNGGIVVIAQALCIPWMRCINPNTHSIRTGIIVRSSNGMRPHTTDTIHIKLMIYTSAIKYRKWATIFIKIHWAINLWNFWFISCRE